MDLIIRQARIAEVESLVDIAITDGKFVEISPRIAQKSQQEINAEGKLVAPPFVESHVHLDDGLSAGYPRFNESGTLQEAITIASERKAKITTSAVIDNAEELVRWLIANGVLHIRAHTDFAADFKKLEAILTVKESFNEFVDIQIVAFPQEGIFLQAGAKEWFAEAIKMGADVIGGLPQAEITREDGIKQIEYIFDLAEKYNKLIDIHTDETGDPQSRYLEVIAKYALQYDMPGRVTASHTTALHNYQNDYAAKVINHVHEADLNIVTNPTSNAILQNRWDGYPKYRGVTRVDELLAAGVNVSIGNDNIMDPFGPFGKGSMLQAAHLLAHTGHLTSQAQIRDLFAMITTNGARTLHKKAYGITLDAPANCIILDAANEHEAIRLTSECLYVIKDGKIISKTKPATRQLQLKGSTALVDFKRA
ncbi:MAG TPA: amidohydrolase family protein [Pseudogracilibacillus sp.]|nr:amidohydrolase family protein [Pseudogracilibacillus sp.]